MALEQNETLTSFNLYSNDIGGHRRYDYPGTGSLKVVKERRSMGIRAFADALSINRVLTSLDLGKNGIDPKDAEMLGGALAGNSSCKVRL